jgi:hypothetical protein
VSHISWPDCIELIAPFYSCRGQDLKELVELSHQSSTTIILDEVNLCSLISIVAQVLIMQTKFYSWYIYHDNEVDEGKSISSAEYVEDVNSDSVVIVDGLTKVLLLYSFVRHGT